MQLSTFFQAAVLSSLYLFAVVYGLKCFQCNSYEHPECLTLNKNDTSSPYYKDCKEQHPENTTFCRKVYQKLENDEETVRIKRSCGWIIYKDQKDHCWRADTDFKKERVCQCFGDACNSSPKSQTYIFGSLIAATIFLVYR